jgi:hypothetical protein
VATPGEALAVKKGRCRNCLGWLLVVALLGLKMRHARAMMVVLGCGTWRLQSVVAFGEERRGEVEFRIEREEERSKVDFASSMILCKG